MTENDSAKRFRNLLAEMLMLNQADLDFGIYRIMNARRVEISRFLDDDLLPQIHQELQRNQTGDHEALERQLAEVIEAARAAGFDQEQAENAPKARELRAKIGDAMDVPRAEREVFNHLYNFFSRYYQEGDFLSLRRYKRDVYALPYEGEEVKLHWANADQYYIKTSEFFRDYSFTLADGRRVHFKLAAADTEQNNNKATGERERRFMLASASDFLRVETDELIVSFIYQPDAEKRKQADINRETVRVVFDALGAGAPPAPKKAAKKGRKKKGGEEAAIATASEARADAVNTELLAWAKALMQPTGTNGNPERTLLEKHLNDYTAKNSFDYFIHKDLSGFLRRELDFYIKNEVMFLDDIERESAPRVENYLALVRAIRRVGLKIIEFLASLEDFQKRLWLKKKFVIETHWCVTLDRVPEEFYAEIAANEAQREEWVRLFAIDEIRTDLACPGYSVPLTIEFLKANPFLVLDTKFFVQEFKDRLLASFDDLDSSINGICFNSENFQALQLIRAVFRERIKCVYADPPYNTDSSPIAYKNGYPSSTWVSLVQDRLLPVIDLLEPQGILCATIDDFQQKELHFVIESIFGKDNLAGTVVIRANPSGRPTPTGFGLAHEYAIFARKTGSVAIGKLPRTEDQLRRYNQSDERGRYQWELFRKRGSGALRSDRPTQYFPLYCKDGRVRVPKLRWKEEEEEYEILEQPIVGEIVAWPIDEEGTQRRWRWGLDAVRRDLTQFKAEVNGDGAVTIYYKYRPSEAGVTPTTVWIDSKYSATEHGTGTLKQLFGFNAFSYSKSIHAVSDCLSISGLSSEGWVLDHFAGSGTTGHAVINLNRVDGEGRKYVLIEMGEYFKTVLIPRLKKIIYSNEWRDGKPTSREGSSHLFKYHRLESYEDTLNNLELQRTEVQASLLEAHDEFREGYMLRYALDVETRGSASLLNIESFADPFNYKLNIATGASINDTRPIAVDLVETFNYLLGLRINHIDAIRGFRVIEGTNPDGEKVLIIWRNAREQDNDALNRFFTEQGYGAQGFSVVYANGDHTLGMTRRDGETWQDRMIEMDFKRLMFEEAA